MATTITWGEVLHLYSTSGEETGHWLAEAMDRDSKKLSVNDLFRGNSKAKCKVKLIICEGRKRTDFVGVELKFLVNAKIAELFRAEKFTGWDMYPVNLYDRNSKLIKDDTYYGFVVHGRIADQKPKLNSDVVQ